MYIAMIVQALKRYIHYRTQLVCIDQLDDRTLRDIGFNRDELHAVAWHRADLAA